MAEIIRHPVPPIGDDYYIPKIEEFHIGFDFELWSELRGEWDKILYSVEHTWYFVNMKLPVHIVKYIEWGQCRRLKTNKCSFCGFCGHEHNN